MKKSKVLFVVLALVVVLSIGLLVACGEDTDTTPTVCEHEYGDWALLVEPTYETVGSAVHICVKCACAEAVNVPVLGDTDVWTAVTTSATHTSSGHITYTSIYGRPVTVTVDRLADHVYDKEVVDARYIKSAADCEHPAVYYKTCECGVVGTDTFENGEAIGHNMVNDAAVPATCTSTGLSDGTHCSRCGKVGLAQVAEPKTAHVLGAAATCTDDQVCLVCGHVAVAAHHVWGTDYKLVYSVNMSQEDDGSVTTDDPEPTEFHAPYCTVCGAVDTDNKVSHNYSATYLKATKDYFGHEVYSYHKCDDCGYEVKTSDACIGGYVEIGWTAGTTVAPTYTAEGYTEYTYLDYTYTLTTPRLVAPYEGKSYAIYEFTIDDENPNKALSAYDRTTTGGLVAVDSEGKATYTAAPLRGDVTFAMGDAVSSTVAKVTLTVVNGDDTSVYDGYVDLTDGTVVMTTDGLYNKTYLLTPYGTIPVSKISSSSWNYDGKSAIAITYKASCDMGVDHPFSILVDDGDVYYGVSFVGFDGSAVDAKACYSSAVTVLGADGTPVIAYAYDSTSHHVADGYQGTYKVDLGSGDVDITLNGCGSLSVAGGFSGTYTVVSDATYTADVYSVVDGVNTAYYRATIDKTAKRVSLVLPKATISFDMGGKGEAMTAVEQNLNIPYTLTDATPNDEKYTFVGWYTDSACSDSARLNGTITVTSTDAVTVYAKWSDVKVTINVHDVANGDSVIYAVPGDVFEDKLPAYAMGSFHGFYIFDGWYEDSDYTTAFEVTDQTTASNLTVDVYAKYNMAGDWKMTVGGTSSDEYAFTYSEGVWTNANKGINNSQSLMEITAVGGPINVSFTFYASSEAASRWDWLDIWYDVEGESRRTNLTSGGPSTTADDAQTFNAVIPNGGAVNFTYKKDGGGSAGEDTAYIIGLTINGVAIVNTNSPDHKEGTYTLADADNLVLDGYGAFTRGSESGSYELAPEGADCTIIAYTTDKTYKVTLSDSNYTISDYKVSVSFDFGTVGATLDSVDVYYGKEYALPTAPVAEGYVFRNWSSDSDLSDTITSVTVTADTTVYAKYDAAVTITYKFNDGVTADSTATLYANDTVDALAEVTTTVTGKVFAGWYTKDGSTTGDWGDAYAVGSTITESITLYGQWVTPSPFAGTYTLLRMNNDGSYDFYNSDTQKLVLDVFGKGTASAFNGFSYGTKISISFAEDSESVVTITAGSTNYYGIYDATTGIIVRGDSTTGIGSTTFMMVPYNAEYAKADFSLVAWQIGSVYNKLISFEDKNNSNAVVNIFVADSTTVCYGVTWNATDIEGNAITDLADVKNNANMLNIVAGSTTYKYARNSSNSIVVADDTQAVYTNGDDTISFNGADKVVLADGTVGTYTVDAENANIYNVLTSTSNYKVTVNKTNGTYTIAEIRVTVTFVNDKVQVANATPYAGVQYTLPSGDSLAVAGFIFRGWFETEACTGSAVTKATLTADKTYYAKYDAAVTLTFDYNGQDTPAKVVPDKYVGDYVSGIPTVADSVRFGDKVFVGWFTKDAEGEFTADEASTSTKLEGNITYYAKWVIPHALMGVYNYYANLDPNESKVVLEADNLSTSSSRMSIDKLGNVTGFTTGRIDSYNSTTGEFTLVASNMTFYGCYDAATGTIFVEWNATTTPYHDIRFFATQIGDTTPQATLSYSWDQGITKFVRIKYSDNSYKYVLIKDRIMNEVDAWTAVDSQNNAITSFDSFIVSGNAVVEKLTLSVDSNTLSFALINGNYVLSDGKNGTYTNTSAYGDVVLDGYGTITIGSNSASYTISGDKVHYVMNNAMRVIALGSDGTYTKVLDGYQEEYTLPDGTTKIALDGYGNAGEGKTYVVSGATITIYSGETSTTYGIDTTSHTFLGKSAFAGLTFTGTYFDQGENESFNIQFVFDDSTSLSGVLKRGGWPLYEIKFTATFDGTILTMTMTENVSYAADWVGKTLVATLDGNTFTITSWNGASSSNYYTFANNGTLTCADYAG